MLPRSRRQFDALQAMPALTLYKTIRPSINKRRERSKSVTGLFRKHGLVSSSSETHSLLYNCTTCLSCLESLSITLLHNSQDQCHRHSKSVQPNTEKHTPKVWFPDRPSCRVGTVQRCRIPTIHCLPATLHLHCLQATERPISLQGSLCKPPAAACFKPQQVLLLWLMLSCQLAAAAIHSVMAPLCLCLSLMLQPNPVAPPCTIQAHIQLALAHTHAFKVRLQKQHAVAHAPIDTILSMCCAVQTTLQSSAMELQSPPCATAVYMLQGVT